MGTRGIWIGSVVTALAVVAATGCGGKKDGGTGSGSGSAGSATKVDGPPAAGAISAKKLAPIIHELGAAHVMPHSIVIELGMPVIAPDRVHGESAKTKLKIDPEVAGSLRYTGVSELTFTPTQAFDYGKTYKVELARIETTDGVLEPSSGDKWSYAFTTPQFAFLGWAPAEIDVVHHTVQMRVRFSGAVLPNIARAAMTFTIDGKPITDISAIESPDTTALTFELKDPRIAVGSRLGLAIGPGLTAVGDATAAPATADFTVTDTKLTELKAARITEGATGFFLEVICDDKAAPPGQRYAQARDDEEGFSSLSTRCQLTDDSISHIHFDPPVAKTYITSGSAGFRVFGEFKRGAYAVTIDAGTKTIDGGTVLAPLAESFAVAARAPQLAFTASGRYLPRSAWSNLGIKHLNTEAVNLVIRQVPPENLIFWLGNDATDALDERTSDVILKKELPLRSAPDVGATTWLDVATLLPATTKGVLELKLIGIGSQATSRLLLTNMSLIAKKAMGDKGQQSVHVWALDMDSAEQLSGVDMSLVRKSGKVVARCKTSSDSGCTLEPSGDDVAADPDDAEPFAVIARKGDDLTYIRYTDLKADVAESSTGGAAAVDTDSPYHAATFSDRGVYRPGDTAHVVAILRDAKDHAPPAGLPVDVKIIDPRAKTARKLEVKTNAAGEVTFDHALPAFADTGHWRVELEVADKPLTTYNLQVEEFVPERMKVTATPETPETLTGQPLVFDVAAQYLFGGTAVDSGVELACAVAPAQFEPKDNADLTYGIRPHGKPVNLGDSKGQLDPEGKLAIPCGDGTANTTFTSTAQVTATASVLEAGSGRATVKTATALIHPEKFYLGVRTKAGHVATGETFTVEGMVVDWTGKPITTGPAEIAIDLLHVESDYGYSSNEDDAEDHYDRWLREVPDGKLTAKVVGGKFKFDVTPAQADVGYVVRVTAGKAKTELRLDGQYPYYFEDDSEGHFDQTPRPAKPTQLALTVAKDIEVGKDVPVKVRVPYKGKILWTVETDKLVTAEWKDVAGGAAEWSFKLDHYAPNVYVTAFVVKDPHLESKDAFLPDRAFGVASARVTPVEFTSAVTIDAPKSVRSSSPLPITIHGEPGAFAVVSVVDEGILSLTNFQTPDPNAQLFAKRPLGVETYETIGWTMLHQPAGPSSKTGGGDDRDGDGIPDSADAVGGGRVQPVKPVALFSGIVEIGADGKVGVPFTVPSYRGQLRVMAITASATKVGRADAEVIVKDPLVIQVTFPRFVAQNDELEIPVFMTNLSGAPLDVTLALSADNLGVPGIADSKSGPAPLLFTGKDAGSVSIKDGAAETIVFQAKANIPVGGAHLHVIAKAKGPAGAFEVGDELDVPFLPAGPKDHVVQKIKVAAGPLDLVAAATALKGWSPTSETTTFWLTPNPYGESFQHLRYLVHYPYGCIEQTTSIVLPLLHIGAIAQQIDPELAQAKIEDMVIAGINRVFSMETPSGGFGYWPGATEPLEWATAYATHMLLDAKKLGYAVPEDRLKSVLGWIEGRVAAYERGDRIARQPWNHYDEQAEAYLHYVLAMAGKGKKARIAQLIAAVPKNATGEQAEDLYMLKAALYLAGDRRYEKDLKTPDSSPIVEGRINSWSFYSDRRRRGFMLSTFFDLFGNDPAGEALAARVAGELAEQPSSYYNTQELVWGVTGLGKWVTKLASNGNPAGTTLTADGKAVAPRASNAKSPDVTWTMRRASERGKLVLDVPAAAAGMWLVINSDGVRAGNDYKVGGNGLAVQRVYRSLAGTEVDPAQGQLKLGDLLFVEVDVTNSSSSNVQNLALVDRLPAGFEIENPRLGRTTTPDWVKEDDAWATEFMNIRDDRLEAFGELEPNKTKKIVYTVRVVTSGKFTVPPVELEAMYDPTLWARGPGGKAVVSGPWTGKTI